MMNNELKKLNRRELVDVIYQLKKKEEQMQEQIDSLEAALQDKRIRISEAGSIAEAAIGITDIFSAAQTTADMYLDEITCRKASTEKECEKMIEEAEEKVKTIMEEGKKQHALLAARYRNDYKVWKKLRAEIQKLEER